MKIGFVLDDSLDTPDGVQQYVLTLGAWLSTQGYEVHYLVGETVRTDIPYIHSLSRNMNVRFNGNRMSTPLPASRRTIKQLLQRESFDIVHVQMPYSPWLAHRIIKAVNSHTVVFGTFHIAPHSLVVHKANRVLSQWVQSSVQRFDRIVSVSSAAAAFAKETYGLTTTVVPNVIDVDHFKQAEPFNELARKQTIVFLGRLVPRKGCDILLQAIKELKNSEAGVREFEVIICGRGPLQANLERYVAQNELADMVRFAGFVTEADKARYLTSADIAVFPSTGGESFGIVLIEAMAADHPVVLGADNPGYASVLASYPDALFPVSDPVSLANKLAVYLTDAAERQKALQWQRGYVGQFDVASVGTKLIELYEQALHQRTNVR